jgi:hypothetical protein
LKAASARSRARFASVSNLVTPIRTNPLAGQTFLPEDRMPPADCGMLNRANAVPGYLFHLERAPGFVGRCRQDKAQAAPRVRAGFDRLGVADAAG